MPVNDSTPIAEINHKVLVVDISKTVDELPLYDATRHAWRVSKERVEAAEVILPVVNGVIQGAFTADVWHRSTREYFPDFKEFPDRFSFIGREAPQSIRDQYVGKRLPDEFLPAQNPVRYTYRV